MIYQGYGVTVPEVGHLSAGQAWSQDMISSDSRQARLRILVAAPTYRRPALLEKLLESLSRLILPQEADTSFVIIDNDPGGGARPLVSQWQASFGPRLDYAHEHRPGVTYVRNHALALAGEMDLLAFIDDDEFADPAWLLHLVERYRQTGAAAVFGPVSAVYATGTPEWMRRWGVHSRPVSADTDLSRPGATCNCLIDMAVVRSEGLLFDERMTLTGAEDTLFFTRLLDLGHRLTLSKDALVYEHIPQERASPAWLMRRWYRTGLTDAMIAGRYLSPAGARLRSAVHGLIRVAAGGALTGLTFLMTVGLHRRAITARSFTLCRGLGMLAFASGRTFEEYARK